MHRSIRHALKWIAPAIAIPTLAIALPAMASAQTGNHRRAAASETPSWDTHSGSTVRTTGGAKDAIADSAMTSWACHGAADTPWIALDGHRKPYIAYESHQTCVGGFGTQRTCVKLQERDYYGNFYDRTRFYCSVHTAGPTVSKTATSLCTSAGHGTFRSYGQGFAYPDGVEHASRPGKSASATEC